jgi:thiamine-phosphate pyrophosphorylase
VFALNSFAAGRFPILCYVTDRHSLAAEGSAAAGVALGRKIQAVMAAGIDCVQIREKDLTARQISDLARDALRSARASTGAAHPIPRIMINDRLDVALVGGADGVHLGETGLPVKDARALIENWSTRRDFVVGVSCHSVEAVGTAASAGADYVFFGPVFATPSKAAFGSPQGLESLGDACRSVTIPVIAIGGITLENAAQCFAAGAAGIAAIRLFQEGTDPAATVTALRSVAK